MQRTVEFRSAFPNQWQFDEEGTPTAPGARELAEAILAALHQRGVTAGPIEQHSNYGWEFETRFQDLTFHNVVTPMEGEAAMVVETKGDLLNALMLRKPGRKFEGYCAVVGVALAQIPQVSDVQWEEKAK